MLNNIKNEEKTNGCGPLLDGESAKTPPLRQQIFQHVRSIGRCARADIAHALQISAASATTLTADLIASNLLREVDEPTRETGRGRPRVALEVVPEAAHVIGIKLSLKRHCAVLCDFAGRVVETDALPRAGNRVSADDLLSEVSILINRLLDKAGMRAADIAAVGMGIPGLVDQHSGTISWCSLLTETNVDLAPIFRAEFDAPLFLDNDTNMLTLAELWFGVGRDKTDFAVVTIENGVGMGVVLNNRLYRGTHGVGLELGHTKVQLDGALCRCGQRGCLEAYLGDYALTREAAVTLVSVDAKPRNDEEMLELLFQQAKAGHEAAATIFRRAGRYLSIGLANVVQLFDPPLIIVSGDRMRYDHMHADEVLSEMQKLTLPSTREPCQIEIQDYDDMVWARGAIVPALSVLTDRLVGGAGPKGT